MTEQTPDQTKKFLKAPIIRPTRDNPELIPESADGIRYMTAIPRSSGERTPMYERERYYDEDGTEQVVMSGMELEVIDGEEGYPEKTYSRDELDRIRAQNTDRLQDALASRAALQSGVTAEGASIPVTSRTDHPSLVEYDDQGLIKMPDWHSDSGNDSVKPPTQPEAAAPTDKEIFTTKYNDLMTRVALAIENSGHMDPSMSAGDISYRIEQIMKLSRVSDEALVLLKEAKAVCGDLHSAGRDTSSPYHKNVKAGLKRVETLLSTISS